MNHQPFENWLLEDAPLTVEQGRDLQTHLRNCTTCSAIAASNLALHSGRMAAPIPGFVDRFRPRLAAWRKEQIRRQAFGTIVLVLGGVVLLYAVAGPAMIAALQSPAAWLRDVTSLLATTVTLVSVAGEVGGALLRSVRGLLHPAVWWAALAMGAGAVILWTSMMRRLGRAPRGA